MSEAGVHSSTDPILSLRGIRKSYGAVNAVIDVDLDIMRGEVLAICGDNGAGKSSLIKIISGAEEPTNGQICFNGKDVSFRSPSDALEKGVATIYQDLALAPRLSIVQNIFLGSELVRPLIPSLLSVLDKRKMAEQALTYLQRLNPSLTDVNRPVQSLSGAASSHSDCSSLALECLGYNHGRTDSRPRRQRDSTSH